MLVVWALVLMLCNALLVSCIVVLLLANSVICICMWVSTLVQESLVSIVSSIRKP